MTPDAILLLAREALLLMLFACLPPVLGSLVAGLVMSVVQTATQLQESTLTVVPKLAVTVLSLVVAGPWMGRQLTAFTRALLEAMASVQS